MSRYRDKQPPRLVMGKAQGFSAASGLTGALMVSVGTLLPRPHRMDPAQAEQGEIEANKKELPNQTAFQMTIYFN